MKPHLVVKYNTPLEREFPYWEDIIKNKSNAPNSFFPSFDSIAQKFAHNILVTQEYKQKSEKWTKDELKFELDKYYRIILLSAEINKIPDDFVKQIQELPGVESVKAITVDQSIIPISSSQSILRSYDKYDTARKVIGLDHIHFKYQNNGGLGDNDITVAVLDTGVDLNHSELKENIVPGKDFVNIIKGSGQFIGDYLEADEHPDDEVGHGSHVAGIVAGLGKNMSIGVVPKCKIMPVRVLGTMKKGNILLGGGIRENINQGVKYAVDAGADVINMSLGIKHLEGGLPHQEVINYAKSKGVTIVGATGNDGSQEYYYPASLPGVLGVGAINNNGEIANFSTYGNQVDIVAPGVDIYSSYSDNKYAFSSGTSHASPFVAGAIALFKSIAKYRGVHLSNKMINQILIHTSDKNTNQFKDLKHGFGALNLIDAVKYLELNYLS